MVQGAFTTSFHVLRFFFQITAGASRTFLTFGINTIRNVDCLKALKCWECYSDYEPGASRQLSRVQCCGLNTSFYLADPVDRRERYLKELISRLQQKYAEVRLEFDRCRLRFFNVFMEKAGEPREVEAEWEAGRRHSHPTVKSSNVIIIYL